MTSASAPRIYCIAARKAPIVAVFRRGPSDWWHVGRWDLDAPAYEPGAWFKGALHPRRSDLSPDGRWLSYFALKSCATWDLGETYVAVSRLPWLTALAAWSTCGTWTRGFHFHDGADWEIGEPEFGDAAPCRARFGMKATPPEQFASERRSGWQETPDSSPRSPTDMWDQRRNARISRRQPGGSVALVVESLGWPGGEWDGDAVEGLRVSYWLEGEGDVQPLDDAQWADWDRDGRLLVATRAGSLEIREIVGLHQRPVFAHGLAKLAPEPGEAPHWAREW